MTAAALSEISPLAMAFAAAFRPALLAVAPSLPLALLCAWRLEARRGAAWTGLLEALVAAPLFLSPLLVLALIGRVAEASAPSAPLLGFAAAASGFPLALRPLRHTLAARDPRLARVARSLGASDLRVALTIWLPPLLPALLAGLAAGTLRVTVELALVSAPDRMVAAGEVTLALLACAALGLTALLVSAKPTLRGRPA